MSDSDAPLIIRQRGREEYLSSWQSMRDFTNQRSASTVDEIWLVEHPPVFTQGQAGKPEHLLASSDIPLVHSDRGGQVTYHGPGQLVVYPLLDLRRLKLGVRELVTQIELSVVDFLAQLSISAAPRADAPGVYVGQRKIASLGLRVRKGCSYHGLAINIEGDLNPFLLINPCGYAGLQMVNLRELTDTALSFEALAHRYLHCFCERLGLRLELPAKT